MPIPSGVSLLAELEGQSQRRGSSELSGLVRDGFIAEVILDAINDGEGSVIGDYFAHHFAKNKIRLFQPKE